MRGWLDNVIRDGEASPGFLNVRVPIPGADMDNLLNYRATIVDERIFDEGGIPPDPEPEPEPEVGEVTWAEFKDLEPTSFLNGKRFRITDQEGMLVEKSGDRFHQLTDHLPEMAWEERPNRALPKWKHWHIRITSFYGNTVNIICRNNGMGWLATSRVVLYSGEYNDSVGNTLTASPFRLFPVPFELVGLGEVSFIATFTAVTNNRTIRLYVSNVDTGSGTEVYSIANATAQVMSRVIEVIKPDVFRSGTPTTSLYPNGGAGIGVNVTAYPLSDLDSVLWLKPFCTNTVAANITTMTLARLIITPGVGYA